MHTIPLFLSKICHFKCCSTHAAIVTTVDKQSKYLPFIYAILEIHLSGQVIIHFKYGNA